MTELFRSDLSSSTGFYFPAGALEYDATNDWIENNQTYTTWVNGTTLVGPNVKFSIDILIAEDLTADSFYPGLLVRCPDTTSYADGTSLFVRFCIENGSCGQILLDQNGTFTAPTFTAVTGLSEDDSVITLGVLVDSFNIMRCYINNVEVYRQVVTAPLTGDYVAASISETHLHYITGWFVESAEDPYTLFYDFFAGPNGSAANEYSWTTPTGFPSKQSGKLRLLTDITDYASCDAYLDYKHVEGQGGDLDIYLEATIGTYDDGNKGFYIRCAGQPPSGSWLQVLLAGGNIQIGEAIGYGNNVRATAAFTITTADVVKLHIVKDGANFSVYAWIAGSEPGSPTVSWGSAGHMVDDSFSMHVSTSDTDTAFHVDVDNVILKSLKKSLLTPNDMGAELSVGNWEDFAGMDTVVRGSTNSHIGNYSIEGAFSGDALIRINADYILPYLTPGETVTFAVWMLRASGAGANKCRLDIPWFNSGWSNLQEDTGDYVDVTNAAWVRLSVNSVVPSGASHLWFGVSISTSSISGSGNGGAGTMLLDSASALVPFPVPGSSEVALLQENEFRIALETGAGYLILE